MKSLIVSSVAILSAACTSAPDPYTSVPVDIVQGKLVRVWGTSGERIADGAKVTGYAKRRLAPNGAVNEHLHAEALAADGHVLEAKDVKWTTEASVRVKASTSFRTTFNSMPTGEPSRIRLRVVEGPTHE